MLNAHEREALTAIESRLRRDDPHLAAMLGVGSASRAGRGVVVWSAHVLALIAMIAAMLMALDAVPPGPAVFFAVMIGLSLGMTRRLWSGRAPGATGTARSSRPGRP